jgi:hypothetical protein
LEGSGADFLASSAAGAVNEIRKSRRDPKRIVA